VDFIIDDWLTIPKLSVGDCSCGWFGATQYCEVAGDAVSTDGQSNVLVQLFVWIPCGEQVPQSPHCQVSAEQAGV
jgi:hypothetical protein